MKYAPADRLASLVLLSALLLGLGGLTSCGGGSVTVSGFDPSLSSDSIVGTLIDDSNGQPVAGAIVLLEQADSSGVDRVVVSASSGSDGSFEFTGLTTGNYDVVAAGSATTANGSTITYAATVTFQVPTGASVNNVPLVPEYGDAMPYGVPAGIGATVTASGAGPVQVDVKLSALQRAAPAGGSPVAMTIPAFSGSTPKITTAADPQCPAGTACANYTLQVPSSSPVVGTFNPAGTSYAIPAPAPVEVIYTIEGRAYIHGGSAPDCNPSTQTAGPVVPRGTIASVLPNLAFTGCM